MELVKITDLTAKFGLSSRTLRYYEQAGLITSIRPEFEKYRFFDEKNVERLKQIIVLRKMEIPIRDIQHIYESEDMSVLVETFVQRINEIDRQTTALSELKQVINSFLDQMLQNGIKKISALPLLYEKMNKELEVIEKGENISMDKLVNIHNRLKKPIEVRVVKLLPMEMLCSKLKGSGISDTDGFWQYLDNNGLLNCFEEHTIFEFQDEKNNSVIIARKPNELQESQYSDFTFNGGLYAVTNTYSDEDIDCLFASVVQYFDDNKFYQVDYKRADSKPLIESVLSPEGHRDRIELFVPIEPRVPERTIFEDKKVLKDITWEQIEAENPILSKKNIVLSELKPIQSPFFKINENGEAEYVPYISIRVLSTETAVKIPFRVDIEFKVDEQSKRFGYGADEGSIRIDYGNSFFGFNMENNADKNLSQEAIVFTEPILGDIIKLPKLGKIKENEYNKLTWIVGQKQFAVILNGEVRYCAEDMPYMNMDLRLQQGNNIIIGSNGQGKKLIKSIAVSQLRSKPKYILKGGNLSMETKRSNNSISNIHRMVTLHYGENYWFNGCAKYVMECKNEPDYTYEFFAGLTGDNFTQIYFLDHFYGDSATDYLLSEQGGEYIEQLFDKIGYACSFIPNKQLLKNREMYLQTLISYIDKGIPVIRYHRMWSVIVGYEEFGQVLLVMTEDKAEPIRIKFENIFDIDDITSSEAEDYGYGWIFVGEKKRQVDLKEIYRDVIVNLSKQLTFSNNMFCFGANAFRAWAADIKSGKYDNMKPEEFDDWTMHTCFVCNLATNSGCCQNFLKKAQELNEDFSFLEDIRNEYKKTGQLWNNNKGEDLEALGGGFNITLENLKNKENRDKIADKILEFAACMDRVIAILKKQFEETKEPKYTIECSKQSFPKCRFIGIKYKNCDRKDGTFDEKWSEFKQKGNFKKLEALLTNEFREEYAECNAYIGLEKNKYGADDKYYEYWIGMFLPVGSKVPEGFEYIDLDYDYAGICFITGNEDDVFMHEGECYNVLVSHNMTVLGDTDGGCYMFERYVLPRSKADETGKVTLDLGFFVNELNTVGAIKAGVEELEYFNMPAARVIGKSFRCIMDRSLPNPIPAFWDKCIEEGVLDKCKSMPRLFNAMLGFTDDYDKETNTFLYIVGVMCPKNTPVPEGYTYRDIPATIVSKGKYGQWLDECKTIWEKDGYKWNASEGQCWNSELYIDGEDTDGFRLLCGVVKI